jgi:hypothetical protein
MHTLFVQRDPQAPLFLHARPTFSVHDCMCILLHSFDSPSLTALLHMHLCVPSYTAAWTLHLTHRVGQNRIYTPYMTVCMVISLPKIPYIHRIHLYMYGSGQPYLHTHSGLIQMCESTTRLHTSSGRRTHTGPLRTHFVRTKIRAPTEHVLTLHRRV